MFHHQQLPESDFDLTLRGRLNDPRPQQIGERMRREGNAEEAGNVYACTLYSGQNRYYVLQDPQLFETMEFFSIVDHFERAAFNHLVGVSGRRAGEGRNGPGFGPAYDWLSRERRRSDGTIALCSRSSLRFSLEPMLSELHDRVLAMVRAIAATHNDPVRAHIFSQEKIYYLSGNKVVRYLSEQRQKAVTFSHTFISFLSV